MLIIRGRGLTHNHQKQSTVVDIEAIATGYQGRWFCQLCGASQDIRRGSGGFSHASQLTTLLKASSAIKEPVGTMDA